MTFTEFYWLLKRYFRRPVVSEYRQGYYHNKLHQSIDGYKKHLALLKSLDERNAIISSKIEHICYHHNIKLGTSFSKAVKKLSPPRYFINKGNFKILFYKQKIGGFNARMELHFYNNEFCYYEIRFSNLTDSERQAILRFIKKKYLPNATKFDEKATIIMDKNKNVVSIENSLDFVIHYFSSTSDVMEKAVTLKQNDAKKIVLKTQFKQQQLASFL